MMRIPALFSTILFLGLQLFAGSPAEAAFPWYYAITGPGGTNEITIDEPGAIVYFQFDALTSDYVWGNVRIDFDPTLLECVSIEETPYADGFWTAWITETAEPAYGGGGSLYYYDSTGYGSDWAHYWVDHYGPLAAGPSGSYDNTLGIIRLYVITNAGGLNGSVPLRIGFRVKQTGSAIFHTYASPGESFSWRLADLPYRHVSTVKIIQQTCAQPPSGMIGWWPGDGNVNDIIGGHSGALINGAAFASGMVGDAISFDGVDDRMEVSPGADLDITGPLSIDAWFKLAAPPSSMSSPVVAKWGDSLYGGAGYGLFVLGPGYLPGPGGKAAFLVSSTGGDIYIVASPAPISLNEWHHLAGTYDGASLKLYVDGVMVAERAYSAGVNVNSVPLVMGSYNPRYTSFTGPLRGFIDEVELFNRALSANEIRAIHHAGSAGKCKNRTPAAAAGPDQTTETTSCAGASVTLDGSGSSDPDGDALTYTWTWPGGSAEGVNPTVTLPYGETAVTLTVDDGKGGTSTDEVAISVVDTTAPVLNVSLSPNVLWPPNHKYGKVAPSIAVQDACAESVAVELLSSSSSEPDNGLGDGDTADDIVVNADGTLSLRAERSGTGSGRTYTILYQATDRGGNSTTAAATVTVPHDTK